MVTNEIIQDNVIEIKYEDSFVAFLDVLGFTNLVKNNETSKINTYLNQIEIAISYLKEVSIIDNIDIGYILISDSIIIYIEKKENVSENIKILKHLCIAIGFLQSYLSYQDIWLRGAISSGEAYFNQEKNQIIGKAYINAYLLENELVTNPQVILDNKIIKELGFKNSNDLIDVINDKKNGYLKLDNCGKTILYDWNETNYIEQDFPLFIDYLSVSFNISSETLYRSYCERKGKTKEELIRYFYNLNSAIVLNIEKNIYSHTNLYAKYKWVTNYTLSLINKNPNILNLEFKKRLERL